MVGRGGQRDPDHPAQAFWEDIDHEHGGEVPFCGVRGQGRPVRRPGYLERGEVPQASGDIPGAHAQLCGYQGDILCAGEESDVPRD